MDGNAKVDVYAVMCQLADPNNESHIAAVNALREILEAADQVLSKEWECSAFQPECVRLDAALERACFPTSAEVSA